MLSDANVMMLMEIRITFGNIHSRLLNKPCVTYKTWGDAANRGLYNLVNSRVHMKNLERQVFVIYKNILRE